MMAALSSGEPAMSPCSTAAATIRPAPTSTDEQWREVTRVVVDRGLIPLVDIAYQGFGRGLDEDARGLRGMLGACDEVIVAQSCDKNFTVYRDRVGALFVKTGSRGGDARGDGARVPARARNVVDAARPWRGRGAHRPRGSRAPRRLAGRARPQCATASTRCASGSPPPIRASRSSAGSSACSRCFRCPGSGAEAARRTIRSTWPRAGASTSSAWAMEQIDRFIAAVVEALDA